MPLEKLDLCLYGKNHGIEARDVATAADLTLQQVQAVWKDIDRKRSTTRPLHLPPLLIDDVREILTTHSKSAP